jgi:hypothetical protein
MMRERLLDARLWLNSATVGALPDGGLSDGTYPVTVTATDAAGNVSDTTTLYLPLIAR